jgi:hypothetical protein
LKIDWSVARVSKISIDGGRTVVGVAAAMLVAGPSEVLARAVGVSHLRKGTHDEQAQRDGFGD